MSGYSFTKMSQEIMPVERITVSSTQLHLPLVIYERLGKPEKILVYYDRDAGAIKLEPNTEDPYARTIKVQKGKYFSISIRLAKFMPKGVYALEDNKEFIFVKGGDHASSK